MLREDVKEGEENLKRVKIGGEGTQREIMGKGCPKNRQEMSSKA